MKWPIQAHCNVSSGRHSDKLNLERIPTLTGIHNNTQTTYYVASTNGTTYYGNILMKGLSELT